MDFLVDVLYSVSQSLLWPVLILLLVCSLLILAVAGYTLRSAIDRATTGRKWFALMNALKNEGSHVAADSSTDHLSAKAISSWRSRATFGVISQFARRVDREAANATTTYVIGDIERQALRFLRRMQIFIRIGPMLGLVGTLLPLGPALQQLSDSDLAGVGSQLSIAFTTTVFGIFIGGSAYVLYMVNRTWFEQDLSDLELLVSSWRQQADQHAP